MEEGNRTGATVDDSLVQLAREEKLKLILFSTRKAKSYESFQMFNSCKAKQNVAKKI
jgi:hypothetical protein